ncbi:MAG: hypothetical protein RJB37_2081 [Pseudomonadota bacterium]
MEALKNNLREYGMLMSLIAIMAFFQVMTDGTLMQPLNLTNLILQNSYIVIMALGMLLVIVAGHIDLSVGSVVGFIGALAAVLMVQYNWHFVPATLVCLVCGGLIGAAQGWFVAFMKIPSFIVTLAGMLVFKGLSLALLQGQSVGPFPDTFQLLSSGFIPDVFEGETLRVTSLVIGLALAVGLTWLKVRERAQQAAHGMASEPLVFFAGKNLVFVGLIVLFAYLLSTYKGLPNVLIIMALLAAHRHRPAPLRARRQREGGAAVGHQDRPAVVLGLREHGRAGGAGGAGVRGAAQHGHAQGGSRLRAGRDRGVFHRRRVGLRRGGQGAGGGDRRLYHGRDEQRHVHHRHRHRLPAGHQGSGAARCGLRGRVQQEEGMR